MRRTRLSNLPAPALPGSGSTGRRLSLKAPSQPHGSPAYDRSLTVAYGTLEVNLLPSHESSDGLEMTRPHEPQYGGGFSSFCVFFLQNSVLHLIPLLALSVYSSVYGRENDQK